MGLSLRQIIEAPTWADLRSRLISAVILGLAVLALAVIGDWPFRVLCCLAAGIVFDEWSRMTRAKRAGPIFTFARRALFLSLLLFFFGFNGLSVAVVALASLFIAFVDRRERKADWVLGGLVYAALAGLAPGMLRGEEWEGLAALGLVICVVWPTDIFAYFAGRTIGGPKLMPAVSPKKTISGALGGLVAGVLFGAGFHYWLTGSVSVLLVAFVMVLSMLGQLGDLFESWVKRRFGVKDSGRIIPGHGGLMDRIDALAVAIAAAWAFGTVLNGFDHPAGAIIGL